MVQSSLAWLRCGGASFVLTLALGQGWACSDVRPGGPPPGAASTPTVPVSSVPPAHSSAAPKPAPRPEPSSLFDTAQRVVDVAINLDEPQARLFITLRYSRVVLPADIRLELELRSGTAPPQRRVHSWAQLVAASQGQELSPTAPPKLETDLRFVLPLDIPSDRARKAGASVSYQLQPAGPVGLTGFGQGSH